MGQLLMIHLFLLADDAFRAMEDFYTDSVISVGKAIGKCAKRCAVLQTPRRRCGEGLRLHSSNSFHVEGDTEFRLLRNLSFQNKEA
ncbi:unnamed protein product, partial [Musa acuminata subsp. burmannicoides]